MKLFRYQRADGGEAFTEWLKTLRDRTAEARMRVRLLRLAPGNFGDCEAVGEGVSELRVHVGAGWRIYFGRHGASLVILLCGGDTGSQASDIKQAKHFWADWKRRVAEAYGGLGQVASEAGISRESLYRALSPKGNPTLKTLLVVLKAVGVRLSVELEHPAAA